MENSKLFSKVFIWMFIGLLVTAITNLVIYNNPNTYIEFINSGVYYFIICIELCLVIFLSAKIHKMKAATAIICFVLYSLFTGITTAGIMFIYDMSSIITMFGASALIFLIFGAIGYFTKIDLSRIKNILFIGLIAVIIISIINIFMNVAMIETGVCIVGLLLFLGITAYDIQKIKLMSDDMADNTNVAIFGALQLYLDFINIFLYMLRLFGRSSD